MKVSLTLAWSIISLVTVYLISLSMLDLPTLLILILLSLHCVNIHNPFMLMNISSISIFGSHVMTENCDWKFSLLRRCPTDETSCNLLEILQYAQCNRLCRGLVPQLVPTLHALVDCCKFVFSRIKLINFLVTNSLLTNCASWFDFQ